MPHPKQLLGTSRGTYVYNDPYSRNADWWKNPEDAKKASYVIERNPKQWSIIPFKQGKQNASDLEQKFQFYSSSWKEETQTSSSLSDVFSNINYLKIIGLGKRVIPLILRDLQVEPAPWFVALKALTGENTIGRDTPGDFRKIAAAWIRWGNERRLIR